MSQEQHTQLRSEVCQQVKENTPESIIHLIAKQLERAAEAARRIEEEGIVVRDAKGSVMEHPCIKTELSATKMACELLAKHKSLVKK